MNRDFYLPYLINYAQPMADEIAIFCISVLLAILVSAESQALVSTLLGDSRVGAKDRLHFNVFMHMSVLGTLSFFVAGFGWAKEMDVDTTKFGKHPKLYLLITRLTGPMANLLMANIAASLSWILSRWGFHDQVFSTIVVVNVTMAIYGLLFIPPLPGFSFLQALLPKNNGSEKFVKIFRQVGPVLIVTVFLVIRVVGYEGVSSVFNPIVSAITTFALDI